MSGDDRPAEYQSSDAAPQRDPESQPAHGLYVIANPIGNLGDISLRAAELLARVDILACEDSRVTQKLLDHLQIRRSLVPYHEHNAAKVRPQLLDAMAQNKSVGLVSDAGTPCLADPGFKIVRAARDAGLPVRAVPGASAITAALCVAGLPTDRFFFEGFLPNRRGERRRRLEQLSVIDATLVMLESPNRLVESLNDMRDLLGDREAAVARELTKLYEEVARGTLAQLAAEFSSRPRIRGEIVVIVDRGQAAPLTEAELDRLLAEALMDDKPARVAAKLAKSTPFSRDELYRRALALKRPAR